MRDTVEQAARRIFYARREEASAFTSPQEMKEYLLLEAQAQGMALPAGVGQEVYRLCLAAFDKPVFLRFADKQLLDGQEEFLRKLFGERLQVIIIRDRPELRDLPGLVDEVVGKHPGTVGVELVHAKVGRAVLMIESEYCQLGGPVYKAMLGHNQNRSLYFQGYERYHASVWREVLDTGAAGGSRTC